MISFRALGFFWGQLTPVTVSGLGFRLGFTALKSLTDPEVELGYEAHRALSA